MEDIQREEEEEGVLGKDSWRITKPIGGRGTGYNRRTLRITKPGENERGQGSAVELL